MASRDDLIEAAKAAQTAAMNANLDYIHGRIEHPALRTAHRELAAAKQALEVVV